MSYTALYRKYRPATFDEVSGQDHVVTTLRNQIRAERIGHAYLFCGTRGTGKTSVAKIFARAVNCEHPPDGNPCNECAVCRGILDGSLFNVIEIDAASNNGVDNIRQIREEVAYSPSDGKYKVYIIDEVHMLSAGAFNALLKTLEEPPAYVIFILATTEAQKIPVTILSRCQRYDFHRISQEEITRRLQELLAKENVPADDEALLYIAGKADGGMRDALSLADQCISFYLGQKLTYQRVLDVLGAVDTRVLGELFRGVRKGDVADVLGRLDDLLFKGRDILQLTSDFTEYLRDLLLVKMMGADAGTARLLNVSEENLVILKEEASAAQEDELIRDIRIFSELTARMRFAANKRVLLEVALIKCCRPQMEEDLSSLTQRVRVLEQMLEGGITTVRRENSSGGGAGAAASAGRDFPAVPQQPPRAVYQKATPEQLSQVRQQWNGILSALDNTLFKRTIRKANLKFDASGDDEDVLYLISPEITAAQCAADREAIDRLEEMICDRIGRRIKVKILEEKQEETYAGRLRPVEVMQQARAAIRHEIETVPDEEE